MQLVGNIGNICDVNVGDDAACICSSSTSTVSTAATTLRASYAADVLSSSISDELRAYVAAATSELRRQRQHSEHVSKRQQLNSATAQHAAAASQRDISNLSFGGSAAARQHCMTAVLQHILF